jgi:hypothetical protein
LPYRALGEGTTEGQHPEKQFEVNYRGVVQAADAYEGLTVDLAFELK